MIININKFFQKNDIKFTNEEAGMKWVKSLHSQTLVRIGKSYFVDEEELNDLWRIYIMKKRKHKKEQSERAKLHFKLKKKKTSPNEVTTKQN